MKTDRRSFFKFGAGAVAAAPVAMKQVASDAMLGGGITRPIGVYGTQAGGPKYSPEYIRTELADAMKRMAGLSEKKSSHERHLEPQIAERIDGMRSVSPVNKARMMIEAREAREIARERTWTQRYIEDLKQKLGPLGGML